MASRKPQDQTPEIEQLPDLPDAAYDENAEELPPAAVTLRRGDATVAASSPTLVTKLKSEGWEVAE